MELSSVEIILASFLIALLVVVLYQVQSLSNLKGRVTRLERSGQPRPPLGNAGVPAEVEEEARTLLDAGKKIMAIKVVRDRTGLGLAEAKGIVERL